jgi:hypothetical protein
MYVRVLVPVGRACLPDVEVSKQRRDQVIPSQTSFQGLAQLVCAVMCSTKMILKLLETSIYAFVVYTIQCSTTFP